MVCVQGWTTRSIGGKNEYRNIPMGDWYMIKERYSDQWGKKWTVQ